MDFAEVCTASSGVHHSDALHRGGQDVAHLLSEQFREFHRVGLEGSQPFFPSGRQCKKHAALVVFVHAALDEPLAFGRGDDL